MRTINEDLKWSIVIISSCQHRTFALLLEGSLPDVVSKCRATNYFFGYETVQGNSVELPNQSGSAVISICDYKLVPC